MTRRLPRSWTVEQVHSLSQEPDTGGGGADDGGAENDGVGTRSGEDRVDRSLQAMLLGQFGDG